MRQPSVLIVRGAFGEMYEPAWLRALNEIGCKAEMFDSHAFTLPGLAGRVERRLLAGPGIIRLRSALLRKVEEFRPDITLLYQGHYFDRSTVERISAQTTVVGYHNDDPFGPGSRMLRYRHFRKALPAYHGFHVYRQLNVDEALSAGALRAAVIMPAFVPWMDYPRSLSESEEMQYDSDLLFAGHCEPDERCRCLQAALDAGLKLRIHGDPISWNMFAPTPLIAHVGKITHITGDNYRRAISAARISLCFFSKKNRDQYTRRVFEITACAGFLLSERTDAMLELFPEGISAEYFSNPEELVDKAKYYCKNDAARKKIAQAGYRQAHSKGHDIHSRMRQWLADVTRWRAETK